MKATIFSLIVLMSQAVGAQNFIVRGSALGTRDRQPLIMANVALLDPTDSTVIKGVVAKKDGSFVMAIGAQRDALLRITYAGHIASYKDLSEIIINTGSDTIDVGDVLLQPTTTNVVDVMADRPMIEYKDGKKVFNVRESMTTAGGNALDVLKQVPTVNVDLEGNVTIHGMSAVNIMIDNKPISAYGNATQILKSLPAGALDKVEVITNPGAQYDAQGQGGILNLVLAKQRNDGVNGIVDLNLGVYDNYSGATTINTRQESVNIFGGADFYSARQRRYREVTSNFDDGASLLRTGTSNNNNNSFGLRLGADITIDTANSVTISGEYRQNNGTNEDPWQNTFKQANAKPPTYTSMSQVSGGPTASAGVTTTYTMKIGPENHSLVANVYYFPDNYNVTNTLVTTPVNASGFAIGGSTGRRSQTVGTGTYIEGMADYGHPISETMRIDVGVDATLQLIKSEFNFSDLNQSTGLFVPNANLSNGAQHRDGVYAAYIDASEQFGMLGIHAGLRGEHTVNNFVNRDDASLNFDRSFGNLFPSMSASYALTPTQNIQLSYSRRINRPSGPQLNPYVDKTDSLYWKSGNAALLPEYTNSFQLGLLQYIDASVVNVEAFYRQTNNPINVRFREEVEPGVLLEKPYNFGQSIAYGVSGSGNVVLSDWLQINSELSYYYQSAGGEFRGQTYSSNGYGWNARVVANSTLPFDVKSQVFFDYTAPQVIPQGKRYEFYMLSLAFNREFREQHLTIGLSWMDCFNTAQFGGSITGDGFSGELLNRRDYPLVSLNVSYRINDFKGQRPRNSPGVGGGSNTI